MPVRMIVTDLDRTLLRDDKTVSDYTANTLNRCKESGIYIVVATGRPERATRRFQEKIAFDYVIADNGAIVAKDGIAMRNLFIPPEARDSIIPALLGASEVSLITVETGGFVYTNYDGPPWDEGWNIVHTDFRGMTFGDVTKISAECAETGFLSGLVADYPLLRLYSNTGEIWHQITHRDSSKKNAVISLAESLGISACEIAAFGDDYNDVEMLKGCGFGVAVANAIDEAKDAASFVCDTNESDGVAKWIETRILGDA